ncbi:hypothetical protein [Endozoicomonas arenosclerae]|uniref:hypothetical protein n=1 Tax=Endozoicomonas arenosclerae TaxID=1633495 RepID=UPI0007822960|nr:hypothetical protein [Endozoicomonas arenosclerae]
MLQYRLLNRQLFPALLALMLFLQAPDSFSSDQCQTGSCSSSTRYLAPLAALFASVVSYFSWPGTPDSSVPGDEGTCNIHPFELWKPTLNSDFCQSLISSKNRTEAVKLLRETGVMQPATMACNNWQIALSDYFNWRSPGNNATQWQELPVHYGVFQMAAETMDEGEAVDALAHYPSVFSLNSIHIDSQQFILKGYVSTGFMIAPMLKVAECYFVPEEEPVSFGFDEWSGLVGGRMHSLFKAVSGRSMGDWVLESRKPLSKIDIDALFSALGQTLARFHLRHRTSKMEGLSTLSRAVHHDLNFKNVFYDGKSGFSLIDTIGLSVSVLEPSAIRADLQRLFEDIKRYGLDSEGFLSAYVGEWPEDARESLRKEIKVLEAAIKLW